MIKHTLNIEYFTFKSIDDLDEKDQEIIKLAVEQLQHSYSPYSEFQVGAAARLSNDKIALGSNQENASYPLCICGERVALFSASSQWPGVSIDSLAITAKNLNKPVTLPVSPCGACRQVIQEYENRQDTPIRILLKADKDEILMFKSAKDLLPFGFDQSFL